MLTQANPFIIMEYDGKLHFYIHNVRFIVENALFLMRQSNYEYLDKHSFHALCKFESLRSIQLESINMCLLCVHISLLWIVLFLKFGLLVFVKQFFAFHRTYSKHGMWSNANKHSTISVSIFLCSLKRLITLIVKFH